MGVCTPLIVTQAIAALSSPDEASRTQDDDGRRLLPIEEKRRWGWQIVNYQFYRRIRDEEARREYHRDYRRREREAKRTVKKGKGWRKVTPPTAAERNGHGA